MPAMIGIFMASERSGPNVFHYICLLIFLITTIVGVGYIVFSCSELTAGAYAGLNNLDGVLDVQIINHASNGN